MYLSQFAYVRASKSIFYETIMHCQVKLRKNRCKSVRAWKRRKIFGHSRKENSCFGEPSHIHENIASEIHQW